MNEATALYFAQVPRCFFRAEWRTPRKIQAEEVDGIDEEKMETFTLAKEL